MTTTRQLDDWRGRAELVSGPSGHFIVSTISGAPFGTPETMIFAADEQGAPTTWSELATWQPPNHEAALTWARHHAAAADN